MGTKDVELDKLRPEVRRLINLNSPRLTLVGGGASTYFNNMVGFLPEPLLYDLKEQEFRERVKLISGDNNDNAK